ncbi:hypothetical protein [Planctomicrobium piriforme]|uniref:Uncharacterized protein n=1 Tax=Planctomicrobium piriforme TaxID=1576369 RepID=A0A1I3D9G8_9PLAN|nr:hypothetical protein [Planctomicrobium piriforme]SFH83345.1 hypothetical protein SAMN05421753_103145 [Planctomicrobium piriforme]
MQWSAILLAAVMGTNPSTDVAHNTPGAASYASYTQAWHAAQAADRPMLVILNAGADTPEKAIDAATLQADAQVRQQLDNYVVAVIDTTTEHGQKVYELFESPTLPRVVVIDKKQDRQIFRTSDKLSSETLAHVLEQHKSGVAEPATTTSAAKITLPTSMAPKSVYSGCPNCQKRYTY